MNKSTWKLLGTIMAFVLTLKLIDIHENVVGAIFIKYDKVNEQLKSCKKLLESKR